MVEALPEIEHAEINPLVIFPEGRGCTALDFRIFVREQPQY